jgi:hypothetical protein
VDEHNHLIQSGGADNAERGMKSSLSGHAGLGTWEGKELTVIILRNVEKAGTVFSREGLPENPVPIHAGHRSIHRFCRPSSQPGDHFPGNKTAAAGRLRRAMEGPSSAALAAYVKM